MKNIEKRLELVDTICKCRTGSMDDKQYRATVEHVIQQAIAEDRARVVEKWDKYVDVINEDAHYVIHNPVREGFKVVLSSLQITNITKEE